MSQKAIQISPDMHVVAFHNGVMLTPANDIRAVKAPTVANLMKLPFSVYFLDEEGRTILINAEGASVCGFVTPDQSVGKSLVDVSTQDSADKLIDNCRDVMQSGKAKIFEEANVRQDGSTMQFLSIKIPWYDKNEATLGIMGASIVLGKHSLSDALSQLTSLGLLNQEKFTKQQQPMQLGHLKIQDVALTKREMECLQLTVRGFTAKKIAQELGISFRTVEEYLKNIRDKAGVNSKAELIEMTMENFYSSDK